MQSMFDPQWATHNRATVASAELESVRITRKGDGDGVYDPKTNTTTAPEVIVIYEGPARWQKSGKPTKRDNTGDTANFNSVRIQISIEEMTKYQQDVGIFMTKVIPNDAIELVQSPFNEFAVGDTVYVWGDATSSRPWHLTFTCQQNMKQGNM